MTTSIEIRRGDYTGEGIYRTAEGNTRSSLTGIKLQVDSLQEALNKEVIAVSVYASPNSQSITDEGLGSDSFTIKGTITKDTANNVNAIHKALDLRYAIQFWYEHASEGDMKLVWTDEADTGVTMTYTGVLLRGTISYTAGELDTFPFTLQFLLGVIP